MLILFFFFSIVFANIFVFAPTPHFQTALQADALLHGSIAIENPPLLMDFAPFEGRYYWPLGPLPAFLLLPFVALLRPFMDLATIQLIAHSVFVLLIIVWVYRLARVFRYTPTDSLYCAAAFLFASVTFFAILLSNAWSLAHVVTTLFFLIALLEYYTKRRWWVIGPAIALLFLARFTAGIAILFFLLALLFPGYRQPWKPLIKYLLWLLIPMVIAGFLLLLWNWVRFGNMFDNGYMTALIEPEMQRTLRAQYGLFSFKNIPTNFYWYFLAGFTPIKEQGTYHLVWPYIRISEVGLSFFLVAPIYLKLFWARIRDRERLFLWIASLAILFALLSYFASGLSQLGPRYILDLLPLWFVLLLYSFPRRALAGRHWLLIAGSSVANVIFLFLIRA